MGGPLEPRVGNLRQARLPLAVEGPTPSAAVPKVGYAVFRCPSSSSETLGSGGNILGRSTTVLPISYIRSPQSAHRLEAYPRCLGAERVHRDSVVQDVQSCLTETGAVATSMIGEPGPEGCLPPCSDKEHGTFR